MKNQRPVFFIVLAVTLLMAYVAFFGVNIPVGIYDFTLKGAPDMRFGIDIRGGVDAVFEPKDLDRTPTSAEMDAARTIIETRLDQKNILDRDVTVDYANGHILVRFPWKSDETDFNPQQAVAELGETAKLTFRDENGAVLVDGSHVLRNGVANEPSSGGYVVQLEFDAEGARLFDQATAARIGQPIYIYMDETEVSHPTVQNRIPNGQGIITNLGSYENAKALSDKITAGALPFSMTSRNYSTISPSLGSGALSVMVNAGVIAFCIICAFMLIYYRMSGFVACIALLMQVSGMLLALSLPQITLTLPGIAGVILSIGMGVDANVIIAERISEEIKGGKRLETAISAGFKRAFSSVFDGNITTFIAAIVLLLLGSGAMLSFAYSLITGVIFNFIAGVTSSRLMIRSLSSYRFLHNPKLYTCLSRRIV